MQETGCTYGDSRKECTGVWEGGGLSVKDRVKNTRLARPQENRSSSDPENQIKPTSGLGRDPGLRERVQGDEEKSSAVMKMSYFIPKTTRDYHASTEGLIR